MYYNLRIFPRTKDTKRGIYEYVYEVKLKNKEEQNTKTMKINYRKRLKRLKKNAKSFVHSFYTRTLSGWLIIGLLEMF